VKTIAHLEDDDAAFVRAIMDDLLFSANDLVKGHPDALEVIDRMRRFSPPSEDSVTLLDPKTGIAEDLAKEANRLATAYAGKQQAPIISPAEKAQKEVLKEQGLQGVFQPVKVTAGPAQWRLPRVRRMSRGLQVFQALHLSQTTTGGLLDAVFRHVGRAQEIRYWEPTTSFVTIATGPKSGSTGSAYGRALDLMKSAHLNPVGTRSDEILAALGANGFLSDQKTFTPCLTSNRESRR
jgi:hypothetical protein